MYTYYKWDKNSCGEPIFTISSLIGKTFLSVENINNEEIIFKQDNGDIYKFFHEQVCCEHVYVEDICGDLNDLVGVPLIESEEITNNLLNIEDLKPPPNSESYSWTFYKFRTTKGSVVIRWLGQSNGCYSEGVNLILITETPKEFI